MNCPLCRAGALRETTLKSGIHPVLLCDNTECFTWFSRKRDGRMEKDARITITMRNGFSTTRARRDVVNVYPKIV